MQKSTFSRTRRTYYGKEFTSLNVEVYAVKGAYLYTARIYFGEIPYFDDTGFVIHNRSRILNYV
jgi:hypothetical protein